MIPPGFRLQIHEALPSTQDPLTRLAQAGEPEGLAFLARRQTAGRGTQGRVWEGPVGNLHLSILLRPEEPIRLAPQWGLLAGVALTDALLPLLPDPAMLALKWPNDLLLGSAKVAGILTESATDDRGSIAWVVLGIGVNLARAPELPGRATASLAGLGIAPPAPEDFAARLLVALDARRRQRQVEGFAPIRDAWLARGPKEGSALAIRRQGAEIAGHFAGLAEDGSLRVAVGGRVQTLASGEIV
ncbi:biotin--[acetyl-CoA-carboxylase] ligase [Roseomonas sp. HJA6]|uniref:Biotin--[acetyl-CoA-carboxylase] ligase n=1 Tax=Roseomonas alba TaxID=2846776 RepID=A0ABS7A5M7_9PROT|nr:biotin--[acetyl-CoA-carboxylase] ligase [Neoroseomonas alba]